MVSFATFDGGEIDAVLYAAQDLLLQHDRPATVNIHGGPNAQYLFDYDPYVQRLAEEGFVILAPNCRGSTGYGRTFMDLNLRDWGGDDFRDWIAASEWLKSLDGIAPARMALWGRSYGGYATLLALGKAPGAFCCGVCHFGPSDLAQSFQDTTVRSLLVRYLGLPWQNAELYRERSPMSFVDRITVPLLILQGANDKGMPPSQSERVVHRLRELGRQVEYVCYPGEGHGFDQPQHVHDAAERIVAFLRQQTRIGR